MNDFRYDLGYELSPDAPEPEFVPVMPIVIVVPESFGKNFKFSRSANRAKRKSFRGYANNG
jgi:hypothetical protein